MSDRKPILCLDFDGVIHSYSSGWKGADVIPDPPVEGAIAFMLGALREFDVVIFSSRSNQRGGIRAMQRWLREHAGQLCWYETPDGPGLEDVRFVKEKPAALVTIDDRAITFTGEWPSIASLRSFQPWNKRERVAPICLATLNVGGGRICDLCEAVWPEGTEFRCVRATP